MSVSLIPIESLLLFLGSRRPCLAFPVCCFFLSLLFPSFFFLSFSFQISGHSELEFSLFCPVLQIERIASHVVN